MVSHGLHEDVPTAIRPDSAAPSENSAFSFCDPTPQKGIIQIQTDEMNNELNISSQPSIDTRHCGSEKNKVIVQEDKTQESRKQHTSVRKNL